MGSVTTQRLLLPTTADRPRALPSLTREHPTSHAWPSSPLSAHAPMELPALEPERPQPLPSQHAPPHAQYLLQQEPLLPPRKHLELLLLFSSCCYLCSDELIMKKT